MVCVFYDDSNVSCGSTSDLDRRRSLRPYTLPQNRTENETVAIAWLDRNPEYFVHSTGMELEFVAETGFLTFNWTTIGLEVYSCYHQTIRLMKLLASLT